jgi:RNA polymerase primary sigma factor
MKKLRFSEKSALSLYLREIARQQPLSPEDEQKLAARISTGDTKALKKLVTSNLRFVVSVARNYQNQGVPLSDLVAYGNIGLIRAAERFDHRKNFKFVSYAVWWIRQAILTALAEHSRIARVPLNRVATICKAEKVAERLEQKNSRAPTHEELAEEMEMDESQLGNIMAIASSYASLDAKLAHSPTSTLLDFVDDENGEPPDAFLGQMRVKEEARRLLNTLTWREREVVRLYFGIDEAMVRTLEEIGERLSLTRERVRQIKEKALRKMRLIEKFDCVRQCG